MERVLRCKASTMVVADVAKPSQVVKWTALLNETAIVDARNLFRLENVQISFVTFATKETSPLTLVGT